MSKNAKRKLAAIKAAHHEQRMRDNPEYRERVFASQRCADHFTRARVESSFSACKTPEDCVDAALVLVQNVYEAAWRASKEYRD